MFVPLIHRPGEAQVDFGEALVKMNGRLRKVAFLVMALPYSDADFVMAFEREGTETFWEGHVQGFEFFGGVPWRITYDNTKIAVAQIIGGTRERRLTRGFCQLKSHYLFNHHFCRVARGNEKGVVEGRVKYTRLNSFVPVPQMRGFAELNAHLRERCVEDRQRRLRGQSGTKEQLLPEDQKAFLPLPVTPFAACRQVSTTVSSLSLVRFDGNDYSVPVQWAHQSVVVNLQRRIGEWHRTMARRLVFGGVEERNDVEPIAAVAPFRWRLHSASLRSSPLHLHRMGRSHTTKQG